MALYGVGRYDYPLPPLRHETILQRSLSRHPKTRRLASRLELAASFVPKLRQTPMGCTASPKLGLTQLAPRSTPAVLSILPQS